MKANCCRLSSNNISAERSQGEGQGCSEGCKKEKKEKAS